MSSYEDDQLTAIQTQVAAVKEQTAFVGTVYSVLPPQIVFDGATVPVPCIALDTVNLVPGKRVVVGQYGAELVVMGALGDPIGYAAPVDAEPPTHSPGDMWLRTDTGLLYVDVNGAPVVVNPPFPATTPQLATGLGNTATNRWYWIQQGVAGTAAFGLAGRSVVFPFTIHNAKTLEGVMVEVTTADASASIRMGIHRDTNGTPSGGLVSDFGTVSASTTGRRAITGLSVPLIAGQWHLEVVSQGGDPTYRVLEGAVPAVSAGMSASDASGLDVSINRQGWRYSGVTGALANHGAPGDNFSTAVPIMQLRFSA